MQGRWEYRSFVEAGRDAAGLLDRAHQPSLFDRFTWMESLHRHCLPEQGADILHAQEGDAQGWLFLTDSGKHRRSALANWYSFAFRPQFSGHPDANTQHRLLSAMAATLAKRVPRITFYPVVAEDGTLDLLCQAFRTAGWMAITHPMGINHILDLNGRDFATYWAARPGPLRTVVKRKGRQKLFECTIHHDVTDALWDDYQTVYGKSWKITEPYSPFLRAIADMEGAAGTLRLGFARYEGIPVAAQFWTVENGVALVHKVAHDCAYDSKSPGTLLSHHMFRAAIDEDKVSQIDFGTGNNAYKRDWMEGQRYLHRIDAFNPRFASTWLPAARAQISRLVASRLKR